MPITVTFAGHSDAECIALAQLGQSDKVIMRDCGLSAGQISYRLRKAKDLLGNQHGFRTMWRNGEGEVVKRIKDDIVAILRQDVQRNLPRQLIKVPVKGASEKTSSKVSR